MALTFLSLFDVIYSCLMLVTPFLAYIPQYRLIKRNNSTGSFSKLVCFFILLGSVSKIVFFFGEAYRITIFAQSIINVGLQVALLTAFYSIKEHKNKISETSLKSDNEIVSSTLSKSLALTFTMIVLFFYLDNEILTQIIGSLAAILEAVVALPQLLNNYRKKSVKSLRLVNKLDYGASLVCRRCA